MLDYFPFRISLQNLFSVVFFELVFLAFFDKFLTRINKKRGVVLFVFLKH